MKMKTGRKLILFGLLTILFAGCVTRIDWNARIGHYTYDQAVLELGPPDKWARLTDGRLVTDWITRVEYGGTIFVNEENYPGSVGMVTSVPPNTYQEILRLTFTTNNVLCAWVKK